MKPNAQLRWTTNYKLANITVSVLLLIIVCLTILTENGAMRAVKSVILLSKSVLSLHNAVAYSSCAFRIICGRSKVECISTQMPRKQRCKTKNGAVAWLVQALMTDRASIGPSPKNADLPMSFPQIIAAVTHPTSVLEPQAQITT